MTVYADVSTNITQRLVASGTPYLPANIWLNVNYPAVSSSSCSSQAKFKFVLSKINAAGSTTPADVKTCGMTRLPTETSVVNTPGYYASINWKSCIKGRCERKYASSCFWEIETNSLMLTVMIGPPRFGRRPAHLNT